MTAGVRWWELVFKAIQEKTSCQQYTKGLIHYVKSQLTACRVHEGLVVPKPTGE